MNYLKPKKIVETISVLRQRIHERFPDSGLFHVCGDLLSIAQQAEEKSKWFAAPVRWLRVLCWVFSILIVLGSIGTLMLVGDDAMTGKVVDSETSAVKQEAQGDSDDVAIPAQTDESGLGLAELIQLVEAGINDIVLIGAAIFFLLTLETRYKRGRALDAIHDLRSIAHIIDMHQLTKDPERLTNKNYSTTSNSPRNTMTKFELRRYFDYCSELLSLTGKIAAVYVQDFSDSVSLASVNEVETLCTGLSRKIWQKVSMLQDHQEDSREVDPSSQAEPTDDDSG